MGKKATGAQTDLAYVAETTWGTTPASPTMSELRAVSESVDLTKGNLRSHMQDKEIESFVTHTRSYGLLAGLAGSLKASDIAPLLELAPDYLGFRGALCQDHSRIQSLNSSSVRNIRSLITNAKEDSVHVRTGSHQ